MHIDFPAIGWPNPDLCSHMTVCIPRENISAHSEELGNNQTNTQIDTLTDVALLRGRIIFLLKWKKIDVNLICSHSQIYKRKFWFNQFVVSLIKFKIWTKSLNSSFHYYIYTSFISNFISLINDDNWNESSNTFRIWF